VYGFALFCTSNGPFLATSFFALQRGGGAEKMSAMSPLVTIFFFKLDKIRNEQVFRDIRNRVRGWSI
jgi:hypothetical protein